MSLYHLEILENADERIRLKLVSIFKEDYVMAQLFRIISKEDNHGLNYLSLIEMFDYFNKPLQYGDDLFAKANQLPKCELIELEPDLSNTAIQKNGAYTKYRQAPTANKLIYLFKLQGKNKHKLYYFLKDLLQNCDIIEFKWIIKVIGGKELIKPLLEAK